MNLKKLSNSISGIKKENVRQRIVNGGLVFAVLILAIGAINKEPVVTLVPPNLDEKAEVASTDASASYKKSMGMYVATMVGNVTPENVDFIQKELGKLMVPELYQRFQAALEEQAQNIKDQSLSVWFRPGSVRYQASTDVVFVTGTSTTAGPYGDPVQEQRTYEFEFVINNYWPMVRHFDSYSGGPKLNDATVRKQKERKQEKGKEGKEGEDKNVEQEEIPIGRE